MSELYETGRIEGLDPAQADGEAARVFEANVKTWGAPLHTQRLYARRPSIFRGQRAMWGGLAQSGLLDEALHPLVNRRVAGINGCVF